MTNRIITIRWVGLVVTIFVMFNAGETLSATTYEWMHTIRFVAYSPTGFDPRPGHHRLPDAEEIRADLQTLRPYFDGLILYSAFEPAAAILETARELRFQGVLLGVWDVTSETEMERCVALVERFPHLVKAVCLGNEGLTFRWYTHEQLAAAFARMRSLLPKLPLTTTEPISQYGDTDLQEWPDFHAPNIHPVFDSGQHDPDRAAAWTVERARAVHEVTGKPVLCKETGLPSDGAGRFSPQTQRAFWQALQKHIERNPHSSLAFACFEAFDLHWKAAASGIPSEGHWGLWTAERKPKPGVQILDKKLSGSGVRPLLGKHSVESERGVDDR